LPDLGWGERDGAHALTFATGANGLDELRIAPGVPIWERILLSDGSPARLVSSTAEGAVIQLRARISYAWRRPAGHLDRP